MFCYILMQTSCLLFELHLSNHKFGFKTFQISTKKKQNLCTKELTTVGFFRRPFSTICCKSSHSSCKKVPCIKEKNVVGEEGDTHMNGAIQQIKNGRANLQYPVHMVTKQSCLHSHFCIVCKGLST